MNPLEQLTNLWAEHQVLIIVIAVVLGGLSITAAIAWFLRRIVRPAIALVSGAVATGVGAAITGFMADTAAAVGSWVPGG